MVHNSGTHCRVLEPMARVACTLKLTVGVLEPATGVAQLWLDGVYSVTHCGHPGFSSQGGITLTSVSCTL